METTVNQRIEKIINFSKLSLTAFSKKIGVAQTSLRECVVLGREPKHSTLLKILKAEPLISARWLLLGDGEMLMTDNNESAALPHKEEDNSEEPATLSPSVPAPTTATPSIRLCPRIPYNAAAGCLTDTVDGITQVDCEMMPVVSAFPSYDFTIRITGDSMEPRYLSGDEVACKRIDESRFIQWGRVHVLDTTQGVVIKRVYDEGDAIRCVSENKAFYPDFMIPKSDIRSFSLVVGLLRI